MENTEGAGDAVPLVDKLDDDGYHLESQSLGEIERQYAEHSVTRDAQLETLRKTVAKNDVILNELRADLKERQMGLERRTDSYTALLPQRSQLLELRLQGQSLFNAALNEEQLLNVDLTNAEDILSKYSPWDKDALAVLVSEESALTAGIDGYKNWHESAINDLKMIPKKRYCQASMQKVCQDFQQETIDMIKLLTKLTEENEAMLSEQIDLAAVKEEHDRLAALSASKMQRIQELNMQRAEIEERIKVLKETNGKQLDELNQMNFDLEMHRGYLTQMDEKIAELVNSKEQSEQEIEAVNAEWNDCDTVQQETLNQLKEQLEKETGKLETLRADNEIVKNEYADAKLGISNKNHHVRSTECQAKIEEFVGKTENVIGKIEEMREAKIRAEITAQEMKQSLNDSKLELKQLQEKRLALSEQWDGLSRQRENEENIAAGLVKAKTELSDEKLHLMELKKILLDGIQKMEEKINNLDLKSMDERDRANLKIPKIGEKIISDLANGMEKWKMEIKSLSEKGMNIVDEKRHECARSLNDAKETIQKARGENLAMQQQLSAKRRTVSILDDRLEDNKREISELRSIMKLKQNQISDGKSDYDESSQRNVRVLDSGSE